jgi:2-polyprenyl-6-methoxyphenol hydroxylase-like FAD-dependent oxidoreductase
VATVPSHRLVEGYPANLGIARPALHQVLGKRAREAGAQIRLGITADSLEDDGKAVSVRFSDGTTGRFDLVVGADGYLSRTRRQVFPQSPAPEFIGQSVWRYNFPKPPEVTCLRAFEGPIGYGLVPLSDSLMYMYITTPEPGNPRYDPSQLAMSMRSKLKVVPPDIAALREQITDDSAVVYRPLEWLFLESPWYKGRVVLIGDAAHATTPHLGQGAGMAIEDSIVLAEEITRGESVETAFAAFQARRHDRCRYIVESSVAICRSQLGTGPKVEQVAATKAMFERVAQPI